MYKKYMKGFMSPFSLRQIVFLTISLFLIIAVQLSTQTAFAAAPTGTLSSANLLMKGTETKAINTITIVDTNGQVNTTHDIAIRLPASMTNTTWDTSDTSASINVTGTGAVNSTVWYFDNRTLVLDATTNFAPGTTVTVSGLSVVTASQTTVASTDLLWSVDQTASWSGSSNAELEVDATSPVVSGIAYTPSSGGRKVGETVSVLITADAAGYSSSAITVNGQAVTGFTDNANNTYTVTYTVAEGHTDRSAGTLPASVVLSDPAGNTNSAYTTVTANTLSVDANTPTLAETTQVVTPGNDTTPNVSFSSDEAGSIGWAGGCDSVTTSATASTQTVTLDSDGAGTGLGEATFNCTLTVTDAAGNASSGLALTQFIVDTTAPTLLQTTPVTTPTNDQTPAYTYGSNEEGTAVFGGDCKSTDTTTASGANAIDLDSDGAGGNLSAGAHSNCTIQTTDAAGNASNSLAITAFTIDIVAPSGYSVTLNQKPINNSNQTAVSFTFASAEVGATYNYSIDDTNGGTPAVTGSGTIATATDTISSINVSSLDDDTLTLTAYLTDPATNQGGNQTDSATKDTTAPTLLQTTPVTTPTNDQTPAYTYGSNEAGTAVFGGDCKSTDTTTASGANAIDLDSDGAGGNLSAGAHSNCTIQTTDAAGNASNTLAITAFTIDIVAPSGYSVTLNQNPINNSNQTAVSFTFASAEVGATYNYSIDDTNGGTPAVTGSGTIATATDTISNINVSSLDDDTLTLTAYLTDPATNQGGDQTDSATKDATAPTLSQTTPVTTPTNDQTPAYTYGSTEAGTAVFGGDCRSTDTTTASGANAVNLDSDGAGGNLSEATHSNCTIQTTDAAGNASNSLAITTFVIDITSPTPTVTVDTDPIYTGDYIQQVTIKYGESMNNATTPAVVFTGSNWGAPSGGAWSQTTNPNDTYTVNFSQNTTAEYIAAETATVGATSGATDLAGNADNSDSSPAFTVDTVRPTVSNVTPNDFSITDADIGADEFYLDIDYSEAMAGGSTPSVAFTPNIVASGTLTLSGTSGWTDGDTYRIYYNVANAPESLALTDIDITSATDPAGNTQTVYNGGGEGVNVDTVNPTVSNVTPNDTVISDADAGANKFYLDIDYSETMAGGSTPVVAFTPNIIGSGTLTLSGSSGWTDGDTYRIYYNVTDVNEAQTITGINITSGTDFRGNLQTAYNGGGEGVSVDTTNPTFVSAVANSDTNILITMSENVAAVTFGGAADWTATGMTSSAAALNGNNIDLTVNSLNNTGFTAADFAFAVANGGDIQDAAGNPAAAFGPVGITDGQAPLFASAVADDTNGDGTVDQTTITYTETVAITDGNAGDAFPGVTFGNNCVAANADYASAGTTTTVVALTGCDAGGITADPTYAAAAGQIQDIVAIEMPNAETVVGQDVSKPVPKTVTFYDATGSDGKLDLITVIWSKNLAAVANGSADWTLASATDFAAITEGTVECNSGAAGATECDYNFTTTTEKTDVGDLSLAYNGTSVSDGSNNADAVTFTSASSPAFIDGAAPVVKTSTITLYDNAGGDGIADQLIATYSEPIVDDTDAANGWDITSPSNHHHTGGDCTGENAVTDGTNTVKIDFTCDTAVGAVGDMVAAFTANAKIYDAAANQSPSKTFTVSSTPPISNGLLPGPLTNTNVEPATLNTNESGTASITFTSSKAIPKDGKIKVTFGANYYVVQANGGACSSMDGTFALSTNGQEVTISRQSDGTSAAVGPHTCTIGNVVNPSQPGATGTYQIATTYVSDVAIDEDTAVTEDTIVGDPPLGGGGGTSPSSSPSSTSSDSGSNDDSDDDSDDDSSDTTTTTQSETIEVKDEDIKKDEDTGEKTAEITEKDKEIVLEDSAADTKVSVTIPPETSVTGNEEWDGKISPPVVQSVDLIGESGASIEGLDESLTQDNVDAVVKIGSTNSPLTFTNEVSIGVKTDLPEGTVVRVLFSQDGTTWENFGVAIVKDGKITFKTDHFSYYAFSKKLAGDEVPVEESTQSDEDIIFNDIEGHWAQSHINEVAKLEIVSGKSEGVFAPNDEVTRAELTKIAVKAFGYTVPETVTNKPFIDVETTDWFAPYIQVAKENNIIQGYGDEFRPNKSINRAEALKILLEASKLDLTGDFTANFDDINQSAWYIKYVAYASNNSIVGGYGDGMFGPGKNMTRAEVTKIIVKIMSLQ